MKAIKLYNIKWDLNDITPDERVKIEKKLPTNKGFIAPDDFDVVEKCPQLLKKHFGQDIITFSYEEIPIFETLDDLLKYFTPSKEKPRKLYLRTGELSSFGEERLEDLKNAMKKRIQKESEGVKKEDMPVLLDTVMLSLEKITGLDWEKDNADDFFEKVMEMIESKVKVHMKKADVDEEDPDDYDEIEELEEKEEE